LFFRLFGNGGLSLRADLEERGRLLKAELNKTYIAEGKRIEAEIRKDYM
jgi:hypothetical protein